jgi:hypothetical protein
MVLCQAYLAVPGLSHQYPSCHPTHSRHADANRPQPEPHRRAHLHPSAPSRPGRGRRHRRGRRLPVPLKASRSRPPSAGTNPVLPPSARPAAGTSAAPVFPTAATFPEISTPAPAPAPAPAAARAVDPVLSRRAGPRPSLVAGGPERPPSPAVAAGSLPACAPPARREVVGGTERWAPVPAGRRQPGPVSVRRPVVSRPVVLLPRRPTQNLRGPVRIEPARASSANGLIFVIGRGSIAIALAGLLVLICKAGSVKKVQGGAFEIEKGRTMWRGKAGGISARDSLKLEIECCVRDECRGEGIFASSHSHFNSQENSFACSMQ